MSLQSSTDLRFYALYEEAYTELRRPDDSEFVKFMT
jgi:hypothetical protein